jgi:adenylate cyclase
VRLACQTRVAGVGRIRLHRLIRDEIDLELCMRAGCSGEAMRSLGEERELALFFLDIRNFTPFVESHLPYDVIHILNRFFALTRDAIEAHGGRVIEVAGDGLYAVFGMECDLAAAVESAVRAGQRILDEIEVYNSILGLHHITLVCSDAQRTVDFYTKVLGLRFVKKTVNFDDPGS